ncbi:MAG TPA: condensation domain-containing protein, partial [Thermoanaerobaculia bacterium]
MDETSKAAGLDAKRLQLLMHLLEEEGVSAQRAPILPLPRDTDRFPLSFAQERLWLIEQIEPGEGAYNVPVALRIVGHLRPAVVSWTIAQVVRRHETLRTRFTVADDGHPVQVVMPPHDVPLPVADLSALPAARREEELVRFSAREAVAPFDLESGPVLRARLVVLGAPSGQPEHALFVTLHHIAADGWSMSILIREVMAFYDAFRMGRKEALPPLPIQYVDYAVWQRQTMGAQALQAALDHWRRQLAAVPVLLLPADRPRPPVQGRSGARLDVVLPESLAGALKALGRREGATLFMLVLAAFQALLGRISGQTDFALGTPVANRHRSETEALIGFFINTLVMRTDLGGDPGFQELLARVKRRATEGFAHGELPFSRVVEELNPERSLAHSPLFQVLFGIGNAPTSSFSLPDLELTSIFPPHLTAIYDLNLSLAEVEGELSGNLEYRTDLFDRTTVARLAGQLERLLAAAVAEPQLPLSRLPLLTAAERQQLAVEWQDTAVADQPAATLHELFAAQAARTPAA